MRFLTDAQASQRFVTLLRALGFDVETVHEHGWGTEPDDEKLVGQARQLGRIFVSFDEFGGDVAVRVAQEIHEYGGRVLRILGGPEQQPERALGRFLFHLPDWQPFLERNDGLVILSDLKNSCRMHLRTEIRAIIRRSNQPMFDEYLRSLAERQRRPRTSRRKVPPGAVRPISWQRSVVGCASAGFRGVGDAQRKGQRPVNFAQSGEPILDEIAR